MSKSVLLNLLSSLGGLFVGFCIALSVATILIYRTHDQKLKTEPMHLLQSTQTPAMPVTSLQKELLDLAETELESGHPERVKKLLSPLVDNWVSVDDKIRGYRLLGDAELYLGHPQLAAPYFEDLYLLKPTAENLLLLAMAYDAGGNINRALENYQELASWEDLPSDIDREMIDWRIEEIEHALGTPIPTPGQ